MRKKPTAAEFIAFAEKRGVTAVRVAAGRYECATPAGTYTIRKVDDLWFIDHPGPDLGGNRSWGDSLAHTTATVASLSARAATPTPNGA
jgi:hypothetical protein